MRMNKKNHPNRLIPHDRDKARSDQVVEKVTKCIFMEPWNMLGTDPEIICHRMNIDESAKPVK